MFKKLFIGLFMLFFTSMYIGESYAIYVGGGFEDKENAENNSFSASTLYFNLTDTSNNPIITPLFYISDLTPDVIRKNTFRINKEGIENFKYNIYFVRTGEEAKLCEGIKAEAKMGGVSYFNGILTDLSIFPRPEITDGSDEWEISITMPLTTWDLRHKNCSFDIVVKGWQLDSDGSWGFSDIAKLDNSISTSTWELPEPVIESLDSTQAIGSETNEINSPDNSSQDSSIESAPTPTPIPTPTPSPEAENSSEVEETVIDQPEEQAVTLQEQDTGDGGEDVIQ